jgi:hypothetical protein
MPRVTTSRIRTAAPMKTRKAIIYTGKTFKVPQCIQRIDHRATHGWQLRYGGTKMFSDGQAGPADALKRATQELLERIAKLPAPSLLQTLPNKTKTSDLPVGISGPIVRTRRGSESRQCSFCVSLPQFGAKMKGTSVYIGCESNYNMQRYERALAKAIKLRKRAEQIYKADATRAKRAEAEMMKANIAARENARAARETARLERAARATSAARSTRAKGAPRTARAARA